MNTELKKKQKYDFEKYFFKVINNLVFEKPMENDRKKTETLSLQRPKQEGILVSEPNCHTTFITNRKEINQNFHE